MATFTGKQLREFKETVFPFLSITNSFIPGRSGQWKENATKFDYAVSKNQKHYDKKNQELINDINIDHASVDEKGNIIYDPQGNYLYSKESLKQRLKAIRDLESTIDEMLFDFEPYFCKTENLPKDLTEEDIQFLKGIIVPYDFIFENISSPQIGFKQ